VDNDPPADATWGTITPGETQIELNWSNPGDADFNTVVILRRAGSAVGDAPTDGTEYSVNDTIGSSTVRYVGSLETFTDTGLTNGTDYYYKIFARDTYINYASGAGTGPHTPIAVTATKLVFTVQPSDTLAGNTITPPIKVEAQDDLGNTDIDYSTDISIAILTNPGGGTLSGTTTVSPSGGVATFYDLSIDNPGVGYTLQATSGSLTEAISAAFNITAVTATKLVFTVQPSDTVAGYTITPPIKVEAQDDLGNKASTYGTDISIAILTNPGGGRHGHLHRDPHEPRRRDALGNHDRVAGEWRGDLRRPLDRQRRGRLHAPGYLGNPDSGHKRDVRHHGLHNRVGHHHALHDHPQSGRKG
jgi:hypothetical protein